MLEREKQFDDLRKEYDGLSKQATTQQKKKQDEIADLIYQFAIQKYDAPDWKESLKHDSTLYLSTLNGLVDTLKCAVEIKKSSVFTQPLQTLCQEGLKKLHELSESAPGHDGPGWGDIKTGITITLGVAVSAALIALVILVNPFFFFVMVGCGIVAGLISYYAISPDKPVSGPERVGFSKELYELAEQVRSMVEAPEQEIELMSHQEQIAKNSYDTVYPPRQTETGSKNQTEKPIVKDQNSNISPKNNY